jgi:hypothetical protein
VGEGSNKLSWEFDTTVPLTEERLYALILDLANTVLAIDETVPKLENDLSLYHLLARRGDESPGGVSQALSAAELGSEEREKVVSSSKRSIKVKDQLIESKTQFDVPSNGIVAVTSSADYDTDVNVPELAESIRPPLVYKIVLHRAKNDAEIGFPRQYDVGKSETQTGKWYNLEAGKYYLSILKGGNPNFILKGDLEIMVKRFE